MILLCLWFLVNDGIVPAGPACNTVHARQVLQKDLRHVFKK